MFWKRFSAAIHLDEEASAGGSSEQSSESSKSRPKLDHSESWLAREQAKKKRQSYVCWAFWFGFFGFVAGVVVLIIFLDNAGIFHKLSEMTGPHPDGDDGGS